MFSLLARRALRLKIAPRVTLSSNFKFSSTRSVHSSGRRLVPHLGRIGLASGVVLGGSLLVATHVTDSTNSTVRDANRPPDRKPVPLPTLLRSYIVYTMCSVPALVDWSPTVLSILMTIPIVRDVTEAIVRLTFFAQFVGGDTAQDAIPLLEQLRAENKGVLFAYSVEVHETEASGKALKQGAQPAQAIHKKIVDEMIRAIDVAADFEDKHGHGNAAGRRTWVAVKMTALLPDSHSLVNLSSHLINTRPTLSTPVAFPGCARSTDLDILRSKSIPTSSPLTQSDITALEDLHANLIKICTRAKERSVRIVIDAEYSWYQPAIDAFTLSLSRQFNKLPSGNSPTADNVQPLVYGTYQAYLRRTPEHLAQSLENAKANNYSLGVKLVRGAYHPHEIAAHRHTDPILADSTTNSHSNSLSISPEIHPPVWSEKVDTDKYYNACARLLISEIKADIDRKGKCSTSTPRLGVLFGTHNWESCDMILKELVDRGLATRDEGNSKDVIRIDMDVTERLAIGQLFGMSDALTDSLVDRTRSLSPFVIKYIPYGALKDVMPYLSRRATENKSVLGNGAAIQERKLAGVAIMNRILQRTVGPNNGK